MNNFRKVKLDDITINLDKIRIPLSSYERSKLEKKYPYYGAQGIIDYVDNFIFDGEYLLVAEDGENLKSQKNKICNLVSGQFWVNNHAHILQPNEENDIRYIYYILNLINFRPYISGSAQPKLTQDNLGKIELTIHDFKSQQKIAAVLSALDSKIKLNNRINTELEAMAKTLYDYWFVQFDFPFDFASTSLSTNAQGKPDKDGKPYKTSGGKMVWNEELKREIPHGWDVGTVLNVAELLGGGTPKTKEPLYWNGSIPFFTPKDTEDSFFVLSTKENITELGLKSCSSKLYAKGTIFITARGTVGNLNIASKDMAMNQSCYAIQPKQNVNSFFLHQCVSDFIKYLKAKANGSIFDAIVSNDFKQTPIVIPPLEVIKDFGCLSENIYEKILNNRLQNQTLAELRDWLLPMLMNGQVQVMPSPQA